MGACDDFSSDSEQNASTAGAAASGPTRSTPAERKRWRDCAGRAIHRSAYAGVSASAAAPPPAIDAPSATSRTASTSRRASSSSL